MPPAPGKSVVARGTIVPGWDYYVIQPRSSAPELLIYFQWPPAIVQVLNGQIERDESVALMVTDCAKIYRTGLVYSLIRLIGLRIKGRLRKIEPLAEEMRLF